MDKNYFLLCRKNYDKILDNLDSIIENFEEIIDYNQFSESSILNSKINKSFFLDKKEEILYLKKECNKYIWENCEHNFIIDLIDITPDSSKTIKYCEICNYCEK
jgi:hypothetical protein